MGDPVLGGGRAHPRKRRHLLDGQGLGHDTLLRARAEREAESKHHGRSIGSS